VRKKVKDIIPDYSIMGEYAEYIAYTSECEALQCDIQRQTKHLREATGDIAECYKKVILDKVWKLCMKKGEFYHKRLNKNMNTMKLVEQLTPQMTEPQWETLLSSISSAQ
jgi:hypothetical protein